MTRIVAGSARGRRLSVPASGTRPTADRVREAVFGSLDSALRASGRHWSQVCFLDAYAGSGAVGLEAASRGASGVLLVERERSALDVLRANVSLLGLDGVVVRGEDVARLARGTATMAYDIAYLDPPYDLPSATLDLVLGDLDHFGWVASGGRVLVERDRRAPPPTWPPAYDVLVPRTYGDTVIHAAIKPEIHDRDDVP